MKQAAFVFVLPWVALPLLGLAGCNGDGPPSTLARLGAPCEDCSKCIPSIEPCECRTCVGTAFDSERSEILTCNHADLKWRTRYECPGGGSVECIEPGRYRWTCLDENGNDVLEQN